MTSTTASSSCIFYRDVFGGWRWEYTAGDGSVTDSMASYDTREECIEAAQAAGVDDAPAPSPEPSRAAIDTLSGRSILCACSDLSQRAFLENALRPARTVFVHRGDEALKALNSEVFDAHVTDYWLPDWSGTSLAREIRKRDPHVPVLFYSKARSDDAKRRSFRAGADVFLNVPVEPSELRERVMRLLSTRQQALLHAEHAARDALHEVTETGLTAAPVAVTSQTMVAAVERRARAKAQQAFIASGGTRADFERAWPRLLAIADLPAYVSRARDPNAEQGRRVSSGSAG